MLNGGGAAPVVNLKDVNAFDASSFFSETRWAVRHEPRHDGEVAFGRGDDAHFPAANGKHGGDDARLRLVAGLCLYFGVDGDVAFVGGAELGAEFDEAFDLLGGVTEHSKARFRFLRHCPHRKVKQDAQARETYQNIRELLHGFLLPATDVRGSSVGEREGGVCGNYLTRSARQNLQVGIADGLIVFAFALRRGVSFGKSSPALGHFEHFCLGFRVCDALGQFEALCSVTPAVFRRQHTTVPREQGETLSVGYGSISTVLQCRAWKAPIDSRCVDTAGLKKELCHGQCQALQTVRRGMQSNCANTAARAAGAPLGSG